MDLSFEVLTDKAALERQRPRILNLFRQSYGQELAPELWSWAYLDNPWGAPVAALAFCEGALVGHYAAIPFHLAAPVGGVMRSALSMTTMVAPDYRKFGLFTRLATATYDELARQGYALVFGWPNAQSAPGFRKRLDWHLEAPDLVARATGASLSASGALRDFLSDDARLGFDVSNEEALRWRLSKPGASIVRDGDVISKSFDGETDLLDLSADVIAQLDPDRRYTVLLDASIGDLERFKLFDYQFGYRPLTGAGEARFQKTMLMSDVF